MIEQLPLVFPRQFEQPGAYWSYVQYPEQVRVWRHVGEHCIDLAWPAFGIRMMDLKKDGHRCEPSN